MIVLRLTCFCHSAPRWSALPQTTGVCSSLLLCLSYASEQPDHTQRLLCVADVSCYSCTCTADAAELLGIATLFCKAVVWMYTAVPGRGLAPSSSLTPVTVRRCNLCPGGRQLLPGRSTFLSVATNKDMHVCKWVTCSSPSVSCLFKPFAYF